MLEYRPKRVGETNYHCSDGPLLGADIARAAGVSVKACRRAMEAYGEANRTADDTIVIMDVADDEIIVPANWTRAQVAIRIARKMGLGKFSDQARAAALRAAHPAPEPPKLRKEDPMGAQNHPWRVGRQGRSFASTQDGLRATLTCKCGNSETINFKALAAAEAMDNKFKQRGWRLDPAKGPCCINTGKDNLMASQPSPAAVAAQAKMFKLLSQHFDTDRGLFADGWSDQKVAEDCGLSVGNVTAVRNAAFGELQEPPEIAQLTSDINALEELLGGCEAGMTAMRSELDRIKAQHSGLKKKFAA